MNKTLSKRIDAINTANNTRLTPIIPSRPKANARAVERRTSYKFSTIYEDNRTAHNCVVTDMSQNGAKVVMKNRSDLPIFVELHIPELSRRAKAKVVWQSGDEAGLLFI